MSAWLTLGAMERMLPTVVIHCDQMSEGRNLLSVSLINMTDSRSIVTMSSIATASQILNKIDT